MKQLVALVADFILLLFSFALPRPLYVSCALIRQLRLLAVVQVKRRFVRLQKKPAVLASVAWNLVPALLELVAALWRAGLSLVPFFLQYQVA